MSEGSIPRGGLDPSDVFIADTGKEVFVWIGGGASPDEKKNAMTYAHVSGVRARGRRDAWQVLIENCDFGAGVELRGCL